MHVAGFCFISGAMTRTRKGKNTIKLDQPGAISNISQTPNQSIRVEVGVWNRRLHQWLLGAAILILDISYVWEKKMLKYWHLMKKSPVFKSTSQHSRLGEEKCLHFYFSTDQFVHWSFKLLSVSQCFIFSIYCSLLPSSCSLKT